MPFFAAVRIYLLLQDSFPWETMNFCLCSWRYALSMSRRADSPFWPSQSARFLSALYDQNDQKPFSWAQSKLSTVQAITKGGLVLLFNKEKPTLQVFRRNRVAGALTSLFAALSNKLLFSIIFLQYVFGLFFCRLFQQGGFQTHSMYFEHKLLFCYTHMRAYTHARSLLATLSCLCSL